MNKPQQESLFGQPVGLYTLFFAEMWERFSYYGMRALLVLYMIKGFLHYQDPDAYKIYGAYCALVYMTPFFGGMLADKLLGARRCVIIGGLLMAAGHLTMTIESKWVFYLALALLVVGNGFFKPNISTIVGSLYGQNDDRRDGGFTIFYMGINLGAAMAPLLCGYVGEKIGWHYGFGLATVGMLIGLAVFIVPNVVAQFLILGGALATAFSMVYLQWIQSNTLLLIVNGFVALALVISGVISFVALGKGGIPDDAGLPPDAERLKKRVGGIFPITWVVYLGIALAVPVVIALIASNRTTSLVSDGFLETMGVGGAFGVLAGTLLKEVSTPTGLILFVTGLGALVYLFVDAIRSTRIERDRMFVVLILMFFSLLFWAFFEQAGSSINTFTDRNVDRVFEDRVVTQSDVGKTIELTINQEQLGYANGDDMMTLTKLDEARKADKKRSDQEQRADGPAPGTGEVEPSAAVESTASTTVEWQVGKDDVGMGIEGSEIPASTFQSVNPIFILVFGLLFTMLWGVLARLKLEPSTPVKFALGLLQLGLGFGVLWYGAAHCDSRGMVSMNWLFLAYFLHTTGELCLSPVGLSMVTRLSPTRLVSTVMGDWFLATAFSSYLAAVIAIFTKVGEGGGGEQVIPVPLETVGVYGGVFGKIALFAIGSSVICFLLVPLLKYWMHEGEVDVEAEQS